jgi:hypothetical protein
MSGGGLRRWVYRKLSHHRAWRVGRGRSGAVGICLSTHDPGHPPINTLERQLGSQFGDPGAGSGLSLEAGGYVLYLTFTGAKSRVQSWAQALHDSGLFVSVDINWGDVPTTAPGV